MAGSHRRGHGHGRDGLQHHALHDDLVHLGVLHQHHFYHVCGMKVTIGMQEDHGGQPDTTGTL